VFSPTPLIAADEPPALSRNPFSRPSSEVVRASTVVPNSDDGAGPIIPLQATMIGRMYRLANIDGRILKRGDKYQGYSLVAIHEQYAVFEAGGEFTTVYVKPLLAENDEQSKENER